MFFVFVFVFGWFGIPYIDLCIGQSFSAFFFHNMLVQTDLSANVWSALLMHAVKTLAYWL